MKYKWSHFYLLPCILGRVYDPNKHCGVMDPESKRPCTRSLTCKVGYMFRSNTHMLFLVLIRPKISGKLKIILLCTQTHSLTHRRTVPGRKKGFDILLAEHKGRAKEKDAGPKRDAASSQSAHPTQPLCAPSSTPSGCHNGKTTPTLKLRLASTHLQRYKQNAVKDALAVKL